jgi:hypothetical protein
MVVRSTHEILGKSVMVGIVWLSLLDSWHRDEEAIQFLNKHRLEEVEE